MGKTKKLVCILGGLLFAVLFIFAINNVSAYAATFTYDETEYNTESAVKSGTKSGLSYYKFNLSDDSSLVYIGGNQTTDECYYVEDIVELFSEITKLQIYFDCKLKGAVSGYYAYYDWDSDELKELLITAIEFGNNFDTSDVSNMTNMFYGEEISIDEDNTVFVGCAGLTSLDLSKLDTAKVTYMGSMFYGCSSLTSLDLSKFDTTNVTVMSSMFYGCSSLTSLDLSKFDTTKVTYMGYMFYGCSSLTSLDLSKFDTTNVKYMGYMFNGCSSLTSLDLSGWVVNVSDDETEYDNTIIDLSTCESLEELTIKDLIMATEIALPYSMYDNDAEKKYIVLPSSNYNIVLEKERKYAFSYKFSYAGKEYDTGAADKEGSKRGLDYYKFDLNDGSSLVYICGEQISDEYYYVKDIVKLFPEITKLQIFFDSKHKGHVSGYYSYCVWNDDLDDEEVSKELTIYGIEFGNNFDTSDVTDMSLMFYGKEYIDYNQENYRLLLGAAGIKSLDVSKINTAMVTNMSEMFFACRSLTDLDLSKFNTANVECFESIFAYCQELKRLDISNWVIKQAEEDCNVIDLSTCSNLGKLIINNFNISTQLILPYGMFDNEGEEKYSILDEGEYNFVLEEKKNIVFQ